MGILNSYLGIGNPGLWGIFLRSSVIRDHSIFFIFGTGWETLSDDFWGEVPVLGAYFHDPFLFFFHTLITRLTKFLLWFFATLDHPNLKDQYCHRVRAALSYACEIEDFDNLIDPCHLYDCCLGPEPLKYVLEKIRREKKSKFVYPFLSFLGIAFFFPYFYFFNFFYRNGHLV